MKYYEAYSINKKLMISFFKKILENNYNRKHLKNCIAYHFSKIDELIEEEELFSKSVESLGTIDVIVNNYGKNEAERFALQIIYETLRINSIDTKIEEDFDKTWVNFENEISDNYWKYTAISNICNFRCLINDGNIELIDNIEINDRSIGKISKLMKWKKSTIEKTIYNYSPTANVSSSILSISSNVNKNETNTIAKSDVSINEKIDNIMLAMRLSGSGDINLEKIYYERYSQFSVGMGGILSSWNMPNYIGNTYILDNERIERTREVYKNIIQLKENNDKYSRNILFAINSFTSLYSRNVSQIQDQVLDCITTLEALWKPTSELSFKIAFRTASLLSTSDDEKIKLYNELSDYYDLRSKIVHGSEIKSKLSSKLMNIEELKNISRKTLIAFINLSLNQNDDFNMKTIYDNIDERLMHNRLKDELQKRMKIIK
jgi:hypothetical protein